MSAPDPSYDEAFDAIPDPVRGPPGPTPPPPALPAPSLTRGDRRRRALAALALGAAWVLALVAHFGLRDALGDPIVLVPLALWSLLAAIALWLGLRPGDRGMPPTARRIAALLVLLPGLYLAIVLLRTPAMPASPVPLTWDTAFPCLRATHMLAVGPLLGAAFVLRRSFLQRPALRGALGGALAGLAGAIGITAHCPVEAVSHILVSHGTAILSGALLGAGLGAIGGRA